MEVYMTNIDRYYNKYDVIKHLALILHGPDYSNVDDVGPGRINFDVFLFNRDESRETCTGALTLPTIEIGNKFLGEYGDSEDYYDPPPKRCIFGGKRMYFRISNRDPRPEVLAKITRFPYIDPTVEDLEEQRKSALESGRVNIRNIQFGWLARDNIYSIEWEHHCVQTGQLQFHYDPPEMYITAQPPGYTGLVAIRLRLSSIGHISVNDNADEPAIYLETWHSPSFEADYQNDTQNQRFASLPIPGHDRIAPYCSGAIRLVCRSEDDLDEFWELYSSFEPQFIKIDCRDVPVEHRNIFSPARLRELQTYLVKLEWSVAFQIESLVRKLRVDVKEMLSLMPRIMRLYSSQGPEYTAKMLRVFGEQLWTSEDSSTEHYDAVDACFSYAKDEYAECVAEEKESSRRKLSSLNMFTSYHVTFTPTSYFHDGPFQERSNRVIRWFPSSRHECFLKVRFADEGGAKYRFNGNIDAESHIRQRFGKVLSGGFLIAGRRFEFLAYTQSSLKQHAVWFLMPFDDPSRGWVNPSYVHKQIGTFSGDLVRCPALYGARISQAFTATDASLVDIEEALFIRDISTPDGEYHYTDGVGTMSREVAQRIWMELKVDKRRLQSRPDSPIPAFQIRIQGYKGMLSIDYKLKGNLICLRPSMKKFPTTEGPLAIEIADFFDRPLKVCLNRPLVMTLECLGVKYKVFEDLQTSAVAHTYRSTQNLDTAARLLENHGLGNSFRLTSIMLGLSRLPGLHEVVQEEAFHKSMLKYAVHHILRDLKYHTRIPVDGAWSLVGVADVHNHLREGEIFACIKPVNGAVIYLDGDVLITRSPVSHPGDVQIARAIGPPPPGSCFEHEPLTNTVVFSTRGSRPLPSMLGGGDLDGDKYNLISLELHPGLRPVNTYEPAGYPRPPKKLLQRDCTTSDVADFILEYIHSDIIGLVASRWLVLADQHEDGILHEDCLKLSQLHSDAVDYPKTGQPVDPEHVPKLHFRRKPDWSAPETVDQESARFYESQRAIGKLSRLINLTELHPDTAVGTPGQNGRQSARHKDSSQDTPSSMDVALSEVLKQRLCNGLDINVLEIDQATRDNIARTFKQYLLGLEDILSAYPLSGTKQLSEEEVILGTIAAKESQMKERREKIAYLRDKTQGLVKWVRDEILGEIDEFDDEECCKRAWLAWELSLVETAYGARSFRYVSLGLIFDFIKELQENDRDPRDHVNRMKRKHSTDDTSRLALKRRRP